MRVFLFFPVLCAIFRALFICVYWPYKTVAGRLSVIWHCFRYGFWWGMDFNAYAFLLPFLGISLVGWIVPALWFYGDILRMVAAALYMTVLYVAFFGKMIFYAQFHDTYNAVARLGRHADKHNLIDIFFHQYRGGWILAAYIPYMAGCLFVLYWFLSLPLWVYVPECPIGVQWLLNSVVFLASIVGFYFFRYGGTLIHDHKPEWDTVPDCVKKDRFLSKAVVDDLIALENAWKYPGSELYTHTDAEDRQTMTAVLPVSPKGVREKEAYFARQARGACIPKPSHIFLIVGESFAQNFWEPDLAGFHIADRCKALLSDAHTVRLNQFLSAGVISRPSIVSLMLGIFDAGLELNENEDFWRGTLPTALPVLLKRLGYKTSYWYGGAVTHGNFQNFAPACGFDQVMAATDFCGPKAPQTWLGVYDHVFLEKAANLIQQEGEGQPSFHFLYTTSNHGPYKLPLQRLGYDIDEVLRDVPDDIRQQRMISRVLGTGWYADRSIAKFIQTMKMKYPDSLFILTGDHSIIFQELQNTSLLPRQYSLRERFCPVFCMNHPALDQKLLQGNCIGGHMNIVPTIVELIAPKGFTYYSLFPSLLEPLDHVVTPNHWLNREFLGSFVEHVQQPLSAKGTDQIRSGLEAPYRMERQGWCSLSGYIARHPELLRPASEWL